MDVVARDADVVGRGAQLRLTWPRPDVALSVPGALGTWESGVLMEVFMSVWISTALRARL